MNFARWVYRVAGIYGILVTLPLLISEKQISVQFPPSLTHPEYFYGFALVVLAWQIAFLLISTNPPQYRSLMLVTVLEKIPYTIAVVSLFVQGRVDRVMLSFGLIDALWGTLFLAAYVRTSGRARNE
jgi:hypothetical protein